MKAPLIAFAGLLAALLVTGCGSAEPDKPEPHEILFDPARGPELAILALPGADDLPGTGWSDCPVVTECPDAGGDLMGPVIRGLPSCSALPSETRGVVEGSDLDWAPADYASVDFSRFSTSGSHVPQAVSVEVRISDTLDEVEERWALTKDFFASGDGRQCYADCLNEAFRSLPDDGGDPVEFTEVPASSSPPHEGIAFALATLTVVDGDELGVTKIEMYRWTYSNAAITVVVAGDPNDLNGEFVGRVLGAIDRTVTEAGEGASDDGAEFASLTR